MMVEKLRKVVSNNGGYVDAATVQGKLNVEKDVLAGMVERGEILSSEDENGTRLFPVFQFSNDMSSLVPDLDRVIKHARENYDWNDTRVILYLLKQISPNWSTRPIDMLWNDESPEVREFMDDYMEYY